MADLFGVDPRKLLQGDAAPSTHLDLYRRIAQVVAMVEHQVQPLDVRPPRELIADAVIEILQQEANQPTDAKRAPFNPSQYQGLIALLFKQTANP